MGEGSEGVSSRRREGGYGQGGRGGREQTCQSVRESEMCGSWQRRPVSASSRRSRPDTCVCGTAGAGERWGGRGWGGWGASRGQQAAAASNLRTAVDRKQEDGAQL